MTNEYDQRLYTINHRKFSSEDSINSSTEKMELINFKIHQSLYFPVWNSIGQFIFSFWDGDRFVGSGASKEPVKASQLAWPVDLGRCKRNCQDCSLKHLRSLKKKGLTTGT